MDEKEKFDDLKKQADKFSSAFILFWENKKVSNYLLGLLAYCAVISSLRQDKRPDISTAYDSIAQDIHNLLKKFQNIEKLDA